jgi:hypothetical protein
MLADIIALSAVYWLAVLSRYLVSHGYELSSYVRLFPTAGLFLIAFYIKGLYPGLLLHPAEEMRRVVYCIASVFVVIGATTFFWRNAEAYSRSVFLITWAVGAPIVLLAARALSSKRKSPDTGIAALICTAGFSRELPAFGKCLEEKIQRMRNVSRLMNIT